MLKEYFRQLRAIILVLISILLIPYPLWSGSLAISVSAQSAILMNADTGAILYEKNARELNYPASTTKIATAAYVLKERGEKLNILIAAEHDCIASISPEQKIRSNYTLPSHWLETGSTHIGIKRGEKLSVLDLLYGMMLASANDAANVLAQFIGGTVPDFMGDLNAYLKEIGCENTHFRNPNGLHHPKHFTTAYDMALITKEGLKDPLFRKIISSVRHTRPKTNKQDPTTIIQSNRLLRKGKYYYQPAIGVKTGYTSLASHTFVGAAKQGDRTLIAVLLKCKEREDIFNDTMKMFKAAFSEKKNQKHLFRKGLQKFAMRVEGASKPVKTYMREDISLHYYPSEVQKIKCQIAWEPINLPVKKHQRVGQLSVVASGGETLKMAPLYAAEDVNQSWLSWIRELHTFWKVLIIGVVIALVILLIASRF